MDKEFDFQGNWTSDTPTKEGLYLYQAKGTWPIRAVSVRRGRWEDAQNPEWLYNLSNDTHVYNNVGKWLGPIPEPK